MKVLELKTFQFNQKCTSDFLLILEENHKFVNQTLHYSNNFKNFIVCHHQLSCHVIVTVFLFKTPYDACKYDNANLIVFSAL